MVTVDTRAVRDYTVNSNSGGRRSLNSQGSDRHKQTPSILRSLLHPSSLDIRTGIFPKSVDYPEGVQTLAGRVPESETWNVSHNLKTSHRKNPRRTRRAGRAGRPGCVCVWVGWGGLMNSDRAVRWGGTAVSGWAVLRSYREQEPRKVIGVCRNPSWLLLSAVSDRD